MNLNRMAEQLILHEGTKRTAYLDTEGYWTVGHGFNLSARGVQELEGIIGRKLPPAAAAVSITLTEARIALDFDIRRLLSYCQEELPWFGGLSEIRQRVVMDMGYNLGHRAEQFVGAIDAAKRQDWLGVAHHLYHSKWAHQVDDGPYRRFGRADRLVRMVITDQDYTR